MNVDSVAAGLRALSSAEVQWSVRAEPLSRVSAGAADSSPPKTPLEPLRRREVCVH